MEQNKYRLVELSDRYLKSLMVLENLSFSIPWKEQMFLEEMGNEKAIYFLAVEGEQVIGYAGMWRILDEGEITNIAVHPDWRRNKVGDILLKALIAKGLEEKLKKITLEVRTSNSAAISLYVKNDFRNIGKRKAYYADTKEDAIIMARDLSERK